MNVEQRPRSAEEPWARPRTEAGKALVKAINGGSINLWRDDPTIDEFVARVETEAAEDALREISGIASRWLTSPDPTLAREVRRIALDAGPDLIPEHPTPEDLEAARKSPWYIGYQAGREAERRVAPSPGPDLREALASALRRSQWWEAAHRGVDASRVSSNDLADAILADPDVRDALSATPRTEASDE